VNKIDVRRHRLPPDWGHERHPATRPDCGENHVLFIGVVIVLIAIVIVIVILHCIESWQAGRRTVL